MANVIFVTCIILIVSNVIMLNAYNAPIHSIIYETEPANPAHISSQIVCNAQPQAVQLV